MLPTNDTALYDMQELAALKTACAASKVVAKPAEIIRELNEMMAIFGSPSLPIRFAKTRDEFAKALEREDGEWLYDQAQKIVPKPEWIASELAWYNNTPSSVWFNTLNESFMSYNRNITDVVCVASWFCVLGIIDNDPTRQAAWHCLRRAFEAGLWMFIPTKDALYVVETPADPRTEPNGDNRAPRLHRADGPAIAYLDYKGYFWHGMAVPEYIIEHPEQITVKDIEETTNLEMRRAKTERYGWGKYVLDSGAEKVQEDEYGTLYRKRVPGDEDIVMVRVTNSTPEPDGSFHEYMIRVPPMTKTAHAGVSWTFGLTPEQYHPRYES